MKYLGGKPRGFAVLTARPKPGRAVAGEFTSPRPSRNGSAGIHTRTLDASVRVGGSTPPDNSRRTCRSRILRGVAFPSRLSQRWITVFNPSLWVSDCTDCATRGLVTLSTAFTLGGKPRGTRPAPPVESPRPLDLSGLVALLGRSRCSLPVVLTSSGQGRADCRRSRQSISWRRSRRPTGPFQSRPVACLTARCRSEIRCVRLRPSVRL